MAIVKKEKFLKDIAMRLGRGSMHFEEEDRPVVMMGGRQVFVAAVGFDNLLGGMAYSVANANGEILPSAHGVRKLSDLDVKTLAAVGSVVVEYARMRQERSRNVTNIQSRLHETSRRSGKGLSL